MPTPLIFGIKFTVRVNGRKRLGINQYCIMREYITNFQKKDNGNIKKEFLTKVTVSFYRTKLRKHNEFPHYFQLQDKTAETQRISLLL